MYFFKYNFCPEISGSPLNPGRIQEKGRKTVDFLPENSGKKEAGFERKKENFQEIKVSPREEGRAEKRERIL